MKDAILRHFSGKFEQFYTPRLEQVRKINGHEFLARCPFHDDHEPSLNFNSETGQFICRGCGAKGDIFTFFGLANGLDPKNSFPKILQALAEEAGLNIIGDESNVPMGDLGKKLAGQKREKDEGHIQAAAIKKVRSYLAALPPATDANAYLARKGVKAVAGLLADGPDLIAPVLGVDAKPMSCQRITPDGSKRFAPGCPTKDGYFVTGPKGEDGPVYLVEGVATGLSIFEATGRTVLIAFSAGNLGAVATMARTRYPARQIVLAADNDTETEGRTGKNPGVEAAQSAAKVVGGLVAIPETGGDWNDCHQTKGLEAVKLGIDAARHIELEPGAEGQQASADRPRIVAVDIHDLLAMDIPPREYVMEPVIPTQGLVLIHALRGIGKTFLAMYIAYCIATAQQVMRWKAPKPRTVIYIDGEMPAVTMQERLAGIVRGYPVEPDHGYLRFINPDLLSERMPNLATNEGQSAVEPWVDGAEVVIVDNLATLCRAGRENETESWHPVQDWILSLRRRGKAVVLIHHSNKSGGQRGTSSREDVLDTVVGLRRPFDYHPEQGARFEIQLEKARGIVGDAAKPFEAILTTDEHGLLTWVCRDLEDLEMQNVMQLNAAGYTIRDIAEETGLSKSKVGRMVRKAKEQGAPCAR